jgi:hypothetical protein
MIDDATSRVFARFVRHDSSAENRRLLGAYVERFGLKIPYSNQDQQPKKARIKFQSTQKVQPADL